jgi:hypothetical protein
VREPLFDLECPEELMKHRLWRKKVWFFMERGENWINLMLLYGFGVNDTSHKG